MLKISVFAVLASYYCTITLQVTRKMSWNNIYLSLHYWDNKTDIELIESFVIDKNIQENVYSRIASELNANKDLAVLIVNLTALLAYRANNQWLHHGK